MHASSGQWMRKAQPCSKEQKDNNEETLLHFATDYAPENVPRPQEKWRACVLLHAVEAYSSNSSTRDVNKPLSKVNCIIAPRVPQSMNS